MLEWLLKIPYMKMPTCIFEWVDCHGSTLTYSDVGGNSNINAIDSCLWTWQPFSGGWMLLLMFFSADIWNVPLVYRVELFDQWELELISVFFFVTRLRGRLIKTGLLDATVFPKTELCYARESEFCPSIEHINRLILKWAPTKRNYLSTSCVKGTSHYQRCKFDYWWLHELGYSLRQLKLLLPITVLAVHLESTPTLNRLFSRRWLVIYWWDHVIVSSKLAPLMYKGDASR